MRAKGTTGVHSARVQPPEQRLPTFRLLRRMIDNPVETWPRAVYQERVFRSRILGCDMLYVMAPDLVRRVLVEDADDFEKGEIFRRGLGPALGDAILTADGSRWRWQRRAVASIFRPEKIRGFVPAMIAAAEQTCDRFRSQPPGTEIDIGREMMRTTLDIILNTVVSGRRGIDWDLMQQSINHYLEPTAWIMALTMSGAPRWVPYPGIRRARRAREHLHRAMDALIDDAKRNPGDGQDILSLLMSATDPETGTSMNEMDLRYNLLTFITAGHETMALVLTWTFYLLSLHPQVEERVRREVAAETGGGPLRAEHIEALAHTRQVIQEAMRLYPPAALIVREARRDLRLGDEDVRAGTTVFVPVYAIHRHEAYWRKPDEFDPSRFQADAIEARDRYTYLPFGAGPRICIGQSFAQWEATAVLATIISSCRLRLRPDYSPELRLRVTLRPAGGMPMRITGVDSV
jgi:cytochrome P450